MHEICRRRFMRGAAALGAASVPGVVAMPLTALAQAAGGFDRAIDAGLSSGCKPVGVSPSAKHGAGPKA